MKIEILCGHCRKPVTVEKVGFRDECPHCEEPLHICLHCRFYAPDKYNHCNEPRAERVLDASKGNRCDWFEPRPAGGGSAGSSAGRDKAEQMLRDLFKK